MRSNPIAISMAILIIATVGAFIQTEGASWDVTSHLLRRPETFFTPSHTMLYAGIGLFVIAAISAPVSGSGVLSGPYNDTYIETYWSG